MRFKEYKRLVEEAMTNLSPAERRVFKLKNFEGKTNAGIAEMRDVSVNTVKTILSEHQIYSQLSEKIR